jgi:hypothetical protein
MDESNRDSKDRLPARFLNRMVFYSSREVGVHLYLAWIARKYFSHKGAS